MDRIRAIIEGRGAWPSRSGLMGIILLLIALVPVNGLSYILPAGQIIEYMGKNFSCFQSLVVRQWAKATDPYGEEEIEMMEQKVWLKAPWLSHCEMGAQPSGDQEFRSISHGCGWCELPEILPLFLQHTPEELINLLSQWGIDISIVSLTHVGNEVAYRIGNKTEMSPYLIVQRDHFLPVLLRICGQGLGTIPFTVEFKDYDKVGEGWYPKRIICTADSGEEEEYVVQRVEANVPIDPSIFSNNKEQPQEIPSEAVHSPDSSERIKDIIETIKKTYQQPLQ